MFMATWLKQIWQRKVELKPNNTSNKKQVFIAGFIGYRSRNLIIFRKLITGYLRD